MKKYSIVKAGLLATALLSQISNTNAQSPNSKSQIPKANTQISNSKDGYRIRVKFTDLKDSLVYLVHYYGKALPEIYKCDSSKVKNGVALFETKEPVVGGIYMVLPSARDRYFEFLLNNGDDISITASMNKLPESVTFKNSPENDRFSAYAKFMNDAGKQQMALSEEMKSAKTSADSAAIREKSAAIYKSVVQYCHDYEQKYPGTLLTSMLNAMEKVEVPEGTHYLPSGKVDSNFAYNYYKAHFWDHFDLQDDRLIHTPFFDAKLDEYFNKLVVPSPDSIIKEADQMLVKTKGTKELYKYTLWWNVTNANNSKYMGMDKVFVHLIDNYYRKGDATWMDNETLEKYLKRARDLSPNLIGNLAPELIAQDFSGKDLPLSSVKAKYTLLVFYSPDCGHCIAEIPKIDSVYRAVLKNKGVKVYAFATEDESKWKEFVEKNKLQDWIHVADWKRHSGYFAKYDVNATPSIYLLDEKKLIQGKKLDYTTIGQVIDMLEMQEKRERVSAQGK